MKYTIKRLASSNTSSVHEEKKISMHILVTLRYYGYLTAARLMRFIAAPYLLCYRGLTLDII